MPARAQAGFTLLEVIVALVVTSIVLAIILDGVGTARRRARIDLERQEAAILARSVAAAELAAPFRPGHRRGHEQGLAWAVQERPVVSDPRGFFVLSQIFITIDGPLGGRLFDGEGRKIKALQP